MNSSADTIMIPIEARSVFRVLAIRKVVENKELLKELGSRFKDILRAIPVSGRILETLPDMYKTEPDSKHRNDFLGYKKPHKGEDEPFSIRTASEERMCKSKQAFFKKQLHYLLLDEKGKKVDEQEIKTIDYQIPLSSSRDAGEGVIDMISTSESKNSIYIIEAKRWGSNEHPLRAMFEAITFWKMIQNGSKKFESFISLYNKSTKNDGAQLPKTPQSVVPVILIPKGGNGKDYSGIYSRMISMYVADFADAKDHKIYQTVYRGILTTGLRCWRYAEDLTIEDFTEEFREHWGIRK